MIRLVLRRNRVRLAVWFVVLVGLFAYVTAYYKDILATQAALDDFAAVSNVPSIKALTGLAAAAEHPRRGGLDQDLDDLRTVPRFGVVFLVTRNGRADEEVGRTELLRSRMLGLHAYSTASWLVNAALCVAVGAFVALVSSVGGLDPDGTGITGSLIVGASLTGVGLGRRRRRRRRRSSDVHLTRGQRARLDHPGRLLRHSDGWRPRRRAPHLGVARRVGAKRCSHGGQTVGGRSSC